MKEIIEKMNELIGVCESRVKGLKTESQELSVLRMNLKRQKEEQDEEQKRIDRENEVLSKKKIIASTLAEAQEIKKENSAESHRLKGQREHFELEKKGLLRDVQLEKYQLGQGQKELAKKEKNYKKEILRQ